VTEHLDPDPEMHTTRELLEHIHALLAQIGQMNEDTGRLRAELGALRSEADQVATVGLAWKRDAERLRTAIEQALDLGEDEGMTRGKMSYPDWWVVLDRALDSRWQQETT
jgi:hypothetical protein